MESTAEILSGIKAIEAKLNGICSKWLTVNEAAIYCKVSESKMRKLIGSGKLPIHRIDGKILLNCRELDYLILTGTARPNKRQREQAEAFI